MRYRIKPWTLHHRSGPYNPDPSDEEGIMLFTKGKSFFIADEHVYYVANLIIDTYEGKNIRNE